MSQERSGSVKKHVVGENILRIDNRFFTRIDNHFLHHVLVRYALLFRYCTYCCRECLSIHHESTWRVTAMPVLSLYQTGQPIPKGYGILSRASGVLGRLAHAKPPVSTGWCWSQNHHTKPHNNKKTKRTKVTRRFAVEPVDLTTVRARQRETSPHTFALCYAERKPGVDDEALGELEWNVPWRIIFVHCILKHLPVLRHVVVFPAIGTPINKSESIADTELSHLAYHQVRHAWTSHASHRTSMMLQH